MTTDTSAIEPETWIEEGRGLPYSQLGDWVNHSGVSDRAARVYWTLCEHLNVKRGDREVWPAQSVLAKVLGIKRVADVAPAIDELVVIGAVAIRAEYDAVGRRVRNRYIIHRSPEDDYDGPRSLADFYKLLRLDDGRRYDAWFAARKQEIAAGLTRLKEERAEADSRAKEAAKRRALGGADSRTSTPPAQMRETAGRAEVRDSSPRGAGSRTAEVRDPALEQDEVQPDESLSPRVPQLPRQAAAATSEREINDEEQMVLAAYTGALGRKPTTAVATRITDQTAKLIADGLPAWWIAGRAKELGEKGWTDLTKHCERSTVPVEVVRPADEQKVCDRGHSKFIPMIRDPERGLINCPDCHPAEIARRHRQGAA